MRPTYEELLACAGRATDQKRNVPDSFESWDARPITLPRICGNYIPTAMGNPRFSSSTPGRDPVADRFALTSKISMLLPTSLSGSAW